MKTEVLIVGAGPAGSSAALTLRRAGVDVILADQCDFPRDKACGDALIPDALKALERLGLRSSVAAAGQASCRLTAVAPNGAEVELGGEFLCLPRLALDSILLRAAQSRGAEFLPQHRAIGPILDGEVVRGARFQTPGSPSETAVEAGVTFLATGAGDRPLTAFGVCLRPGPSALALRAYYQVPQDLAADYRRLIISFHSVTRPGYGWIFPGPDNMLNLGVGVFYAGSRPLASLRHLWQTFIRGFTAAHRIVTEGVPAGPVRGAPLRTGFTGSRLFLNGLFVLGEAAGLTYPFSGEGIGKAMESGIIAGEVLAKVLAGGKVSPVMAGSLYEQAMRSRHSRRYQAYQTAQQWLARPGICNLIAERANASPYLKGQLEGLLTETSDALSIFSVGGLLRSLFR
jgi:geranylgeranyl reductase family protein